MSIERCLTGLVLAFAVVCPAFATEYTVDPAESIFAVVVHKAGIAARFAHNHLVYPSEYAAQLSMENDDPATVKFSLSFPTEKLLVDAADMHKKWYPSLEKAGILDEPFKELDEKDRAAISGHMLDTNQLDAKQFPEISAKLVTLREEASAQGKQRFTHKAAIEFTVHGKTVSRECPASLTVESGRVVVDAMGEFKFSEFGIKPYSAMAGAVKNNDAFHLFVHLSAAPKS